MTDANPGNMKKARYVLRVPGQGADVPLYEGETEAQALTRAAAEYSALAARIERQRREDAAGSPNTMEAEAFYREIGYTPPSERRRGQRGKKGTHNGRLLLRLPISIHEELPAQARRNDTTINQLALAYISKGLGIDAANAMRE